MREIILKPILSEKSLAGGVAGKYIFKVTKDANKPLIAKTIKTLYKVDAIKVNIINNHPEVKVKRGHITQTKAYKKAIVTLKKGQKIEGFEFKD